MEEKNTIGGFEVFNSPEEIVASQSNQQTEEAPQQESQVVSEPVQEQPQVDPQPQPQTGQIVDVPVPEAPQQDAQPQVQTQQEDYAQPEQAESIPYTDQQIEGAVFSYLSEKLGRSIASVDDLAPTPEPLDERVEAIAKFVSETGRAPQEWFTYQSLNTSEMDDVTALKVDTALQYPQLTADEVNTLVQSKYKLNPDLYSEDEIKVSQLQMKVDASNAKNKIEEERMRYAAPEPLDATDQPAIESFIDDEWISNMRSETSELTGLEFDLGSDRTFTFGLDDRYKQELVNKNARLDEYFDPYVREDGSWDFDTLNSHRAIIDNIDAIVASTYRQGLSDGQKNIVQNAANVQAQAPTQTTPQANPLVDQMKTLLTGKNKLTFKV